MRAMRDNFGDAEEGVYRDRKIIPVELLLKPFCREFGRNAFRTDREQNQPLRLSQTAPVNEPSGILQHADAFPTMNTAPWPNWI